MSDNETLKPVIWVGSSKADLMEMPSDVIDDFGYGLHEAQLGDFPAIGSPMKGFGGASVIELTSNDKSSTFRAVYTVRFPRAIMVLHAFQKKSKKGKETPKHEIDLIKSRLKQAEVDYKEWEKDRGK